MAFNDGISSAVAQFVFTQSGGAVTDPVNGSYIQAYCEYLGVTETVNDSWLQALCIHLGITEPLFGSWTIALANYYGLTYPTGGTWWMAMAEGATPPSSDLIWNLVLTEWQLEDEEWATATPPAEPVLTSGSAYTVVLPTFSGTGLIGATLTLEVNNETYTTVVDGSGNWSLTVTDPLPGTSSGTAYTVDISQYRSSDGLSSSISSNPITVTVLFTRVYIQMRDAYGDGWNNGYVKIQKEATPGVWEDQEYNGNPYRYPNASDFLADLPAARQFYKTSSSGLYGLRYEEYEYGISTGGITPFPTQPANRIWSDSQKIRTLDLDPGFNYRSIVGLQGNYDGERDYDIRLDSDDSLIAAVARGTNWTIDTVQATFTL